MKRISTLFMITFSAWFVTSVGEAQTPPRNPMPTATSGWIGNWGMGRQSDIASYTPEQKRQMIEQGYSMLKDIKKQLKGDLTPEERADLLAKKKEIEHEMVELQQN